MNENQLLLHFFERFTRVQLTAELETEIISLFKTKEYKKKTVIFRPGDVNTPHYFVEKGIVRLYLIDKQGKEINILFAREGQFIGI